MDFGSLLEEAREARGLLTAELAAKLSVRRETLYRWERGETKPSREMFVDLLRVLDLPARYFEMEPAPVALGPIFYRSLPSVRRASEVRMAERRLAWLREIILGLEHFVDFPIVDLGSFVGPSDPIDLTTDEIEEQAHELRRTWGLGSGAIGSMPILLNNAGITVSRNHLGVRAIHAFSQPGFKEIRPVIILANDAATAAHTQADCAHELGHLVLHSRVDKRYVFERDRYNLMEQQAWRFARAFLLPAQSFRDSVRTASLNHFAQLKLSWCVSIALMVKRAEDVGLVDKTVARQLWVQRQRRGWTKVEPFDDDFAIDRPSLLKEAVMTLIEAGGALVRNWLNGLRFGLQDVARFTDVDVEVLLRASAVPPARPHLKVAALN